MDNAIRARTPAHLWIVGALATMWNGFGCYDYVKTRMRDTDYLASMMPNADPNAILAWIDAFPLVVQFGWGLGVWAGLLGSLLLLARSRFAVHAFAASFLGIIVSLGYQIVAAPPMPAGAADGMGGVMPYMIIVVGGALLYYAYSQRAKGVLR